MAHPEGTHTYRFASCMNTLPPSFLDELFRVSAVPDIISFAGGLPDASLFDVEGIKKAMESVFDDYGSIALQYTTTDGYRPLREIISRRYYSRLGLHVNPDEIQILNGSQQALDLTAKILTNPNDKILIERPGYLGAIEAFSFYRPSFSSINPDTEGPDPAELKNYIQSDNPVFFYGIPNSQNPSGLTWSDKRRKEVAEILSESDCLLYEDDAFGELFFDGKAREPVMKYLPDQGLMSGSFSKIIAPGLRIGWIRAPPQVLCAFNRAKQAADLHSNLFSQMVMTQYLEKNDIEQRTRMIAAKYGERCRLMIDLIEDLLSDSIHHTIPSGGMFLMLTLPGSMHSMNVFEHGIKEGVAVMPGIPFYIDDGGNSTIRLNFSASSETQIQIGMERLARVFHRL
ncbi:PLP-dependent aminotransferase family protein [Methanospirillum sp. J.3.6.1-F.2.7.3]|uniref:PLP-dependent aminotransferase family protein n=1 Tax=Methanospirillum purgamenti TaxID=2834276 RepID=A0A8E7B3B4_9EURY|nr:MULTISPECIES: PLP-dependent aminotransferase family protein [Methanospirillum]MDX8550758.1 PLP-dependent aminotransferase family protein [Methanospirillum hungatei]QVV90311.1 PLP-dependent aminotransferase family protein [Methanospirillum sp. J.3.6.1-F.2.7.3]